MGAAMESHRDFVLGDGDVGRHVDEIAEDLARLGIVVAAHAAGHEAIEPRCENEQRHVEVDFESGSAKKWRQSVSLYCALIDTYAQCHIAESGVKHKVQAKLYYDQKPTCTRDLFTINATGITAMTLHQTTR